MKIIVAGGRNFKPLMEDYVWLVVQLKSMNATEIVCGCATGADAFGERVAKDMNLPAKKFPADWNLHGRAAGPKRNAEMAQYADACILFPGGRGTADMEEKALKNNLIIVKYA
jgi:hypothetical protein